MPASTLTLPPTGEDVRRRVPARYLAKLGFPVPDDGPEPLDSFCVTACAYIASTTGRPINEQLKVNPPQTNTFLEELEGFVPQAYSDELELAGLAYRAVILRVIQELTHESTAYMSAVVGQDYLTGFKAGSYSESRGDPQTVLRSRGSVSNPLINPWRELSDLLWLLLTPDQFDYWMMRLGSPMPASVFVEQDFRDQWDAPGALPGTLPGFGAPGMGGDWPMGGGNEW